MLIRQTRVPIPTIRAAGLNLVIEWSERQVPWSLLRYLEEGAARSHPSEIVVNYSFNEKSDRVLLQLNSTVSTTGRFPIGIAKAVCRCLSC